VVRYSSARPGNNLAARELLVALFAFYAAQLSYRFLHDVWPKTVPSSMDFKFKVIVK
jgi:hypothetical protein